MSNPERVAAALEQWHHEGRPTRRPRIERPEASIDGRPVLCPSYPAGTGTGAICIVDDDSTQWLAEVVPLDDPRLPGRSGIIRTTGPCLRSGCAYWRDSCQLGAAVASATDVASGAAQPPCPIRERCRWHLEQGASACAGCGGLTRTIRVGVQ